MIDEPRHDRHQPRVGPHRDHVAAHLVTHEDVTQDIDVLPLVDVDAAPQ